MTSRIIHLALLVVLAGCLFWSASGIATADVTPAEQAAMLMAHNALRQSTAASETRRLGQTVTIPDLSWNPTAAAVAQAWANNMLATNTFGHNPNAGDLGENIYKESGSSQGASGDRAFKAWASEVASYTWATNGCADVCGHYTQIVWAASRSVGCGKATGGAGTYWVCDYAPPGNFNGQRPYEPGGPAAQPPAGQAAPGMTVTYAAGWNIVAGPTGSTFTQALGALYTLQAGDAGYQTLAAGAPVVGGSGYWAFFPASASVTITGSGTASVTIDAPAGQWILVGNPSATAAVTVRGADLVYVWDPTANQYTQTTSLPVGRGAWVISNDGAMVSVGP